MQFIFPWAVQEQGFRLCRVLIASDRNFKIQSAFMKRSNYYCHLSFIRFLSQRVAVAFKCSRRFIQFISRASVTRMVSFEAFGPGHPFKSATLRHLQHSSPRKTADVGVVVGAVNYGRQRWLNTCPSSTQGDSYKHRPFDSPERCL